MSQFDDAKTFQRGGMDQNSAPESVDPNDYIEAWNLREGTELQTENYRTSIEGTQALSGSLLPGLNDIVGGGRFDDAGWILGFRFNSAGNHQLVLYNFATNTYQLLFTDLTNSANVPFLPLNPANQVTAILVNKIYAIWWAPGLEVGYTNLVTLAAGGYGSTLLWEDLSLLKPQCTIPPTGTYGSDLGKPANALYGLLPQFIVQYENVDFNKSAWSTRSARIVPYQENTPALGQNVTENNYIIVSVNIGSIRVSVVNIGVQFDDSGNFSICKSVNTAYILALPNTSVNVATEVYEAYDPATNLYSFAFYNNTILTPIDPNETDLSYDYIWPAVSGALLNGNIAGLANFSTLYTRPSISVSVAAVGFNPNIAIPAGTYLNPLTAGPYFAGSSGSGAGDHRRNMWISLSGIPKTGDTVVIIQADIRNSVNTLNNSYVIPAAQSGNLLSVIQSIAATLGGSYVATAGGYTIYWTGMPYFGLQTFAVELYFAGASVANSVPCFVDNSQGQMAVSFMDYKRRYFPLCTDNTFDYNTPSYAQQNGNATEINIQINNANVPEGAVYAQILTTKPPVTKILDVIGTLLVYKGAWNAATNSPTLTVNSDNIGDTYQITTPAIVAFPSTYHNLGSGEDYNTGDYITNIGGTSGGGEIGQYYKVLPKNFGNLALLQGGILVFSLNSLQLLNANYAQENVNTNLVYDFAQGDRCTLHYFLPVTGGIGSFNVIGGSGYTDGVYTGVALSGGTGTGAIATVTASGGTVTNVLITTPGIGYVSGDTSITGTVPGGSGWSLTITQLLPVYFNQPCIDLAVLGYDAGSFLVKVENSSAITNDGMHLYYNGQQIDARNIFIRLYSPQKQTAVASLTINETEWFEIGEVMPIANGQFTDLNFNVQDGGAYYKTRQFPDAIRPYTNPPVDVLATDLNYSDFYPSNYHSFGRVRTFNDEIVQSQRKASIITSQPYIAGSQNNGLNRFYPANIYGDNNGQTSSSKGGIQVMDQRGQELVIFQELGIAYIPVNEAYVVLNDQITGQNISEKLLNNCRYDPENVGIGLTKAYCRRYSLMYFIDPNKSLPFRITSKVEPIAFKMSKFFMALIQAAYALGKNINLFYNDYYEEVVLTIQAEGGIITYFPFSTANWNPLNNYAIVPGDVSATPNGSHSTASYNAGTGVLTYTPDSNYVGNDTATFTFTPPGGSPITLNNCLQWLAAVTTVNAFGFTPVTGQPLSTTVQSINNVTVTGPNVPVPISISGPGAMYSVNGGAFTNVAGTVSPNDTVQVEVLTSASNSTAATAVLNIGGTTGNFVATTVPPGNYSLYAQYNIGIAAVANGTTTGTPTFSGLPLSNGQGVSAAYTTTGGAGATVEVTVTGTPAIPGHIYLGLSVGGVLISSVLVTGPGTYALAFTGTVNDPTAILISVFSI